MTTIWFNQGYSVVRDAILLIREGAEAAGVPGLQLLASHANFQATVLEAADLGFLEPPIDRSTLAGAAEYAAWCAGRCEELGVDIFLVQGGQHAISSHLHLFPSTTRVILPADTQTLEEIADKGLFYGRALAAGIPMPWTRTVANVRELDAALADLAARGLPACVKPREGVFGAGFWRLDEKYDLLDALMGGDRRRVSTQVVRQAIATSARPVRLLAMEYLPGPEWSLDCVCDEGRLILGVARRKRGRVQELEVDGPIFEMGSAAIALFGLSGLINVQFKAVDADGGDPRLLEINPRMSGGVARTRFAGVNLPWRHVALLLGRATADEAPVGGALIATQETGFTVSGRAREVGHV
ncbi:MAG TPA: ATP-grasp domain-containing protein [Allosphingosinicella sp.]|nr:ATP-grasp domain-containing protein [Allosphingosinicella sp.]